MWGIEEMVEDLKLLGKPDFKRLLRWRAILRKDMGLKEEEPENEDGETTTEEPKKNKNDLTAEEREALLEEELEDKLQQLQKRAKKEKRKKRELKKKFQKKVDLKMVVPGDRIEMEEVLIYIYRYSYSILLPIRILFLLCEN
jgi:AdoMet-dependent rRNA methyltransferase SPB1